MSFIVCESVNGTICDNSIRQLTNIVKREHAADSTLWCLINRVPIWCKHWIYCKNYRTEKVFGILVCDIKVPDDLQHNCRTATSAAGWK